MERSLEPSDFDFKYLVISVEPYESIVGYAKDYTAAKDLAVSWLKDQESRDAKVYLAFYEGTGWKENRPALLYRDNYSRTTEALVSD
jgi:hypothetical protein